MVSKIIHKKSTRKAAKDNRQDQRRGGMKGGVKMKRDSEGGVDAKRLKLGVFVSWFTAMAMAFFRNAADGVGDGTGYFLKHIKDHEDVLPCSETIEFSETPDVHFLEAKEKILGAIGYKSGSNKKKGQMNKKAVPLLTEALPEMVDLSGQEIVARSAEWIKTGRNEVFGSGTFRHSTNNSRRNIFAEKGFDTNCEPTETDGRIPIEVLDCQNTMLSEDRIWKAICGKISCILRGIGAKCGLNADKFRPEVLCETYNEKVRVVLQKAQSIHQCSPLLNQYSKRWATGYEPIDDMSIGEVVEKHEKRLDLVKKAMQQLVENSEKEEEVLRKLDEDLVALNIKTKNEDDKDPAAIVTDFATNLDLTEENSPDQMEEIRKLPLFLQPNQGLMVYIEDTISGINAVQAYVKTIGARTSSHTENQCAASVNLNIGPGVCIWFFVPAAYSAKMEALLEKTSSAPYFGYWPLEEDLIAEKIPYQKIEQKADDLVYVGVGSFHWVQANGPCVNISWNIAGVSSVQLAAAALDFDHCLDQKHGTNIPLVSMLWKMAEETEKKHSLEVYKMVRELLISSLAMSKMEEDVLASKGYQAKPIAALESSEHYSHLTIYSVNHCGLVANPYKRAKAPCMNALFNIVVVQKEGHRDKVRCIHCIGKHENKPEIYRRYEFEELVTIFLSLEDHIRAQTPSGTSSDSPSSTARFVFSSAPSTSSFMST